MEVSTYFFEIRNKITSFDHTRGSSKDPGLVIYQNKLIFISVILKKRNMSDIDQVRWLSKDHNWLFSDKRASVRNSEIKKKYKT